jgi:hypothetical protein
MFVQRKLWWVECCISSLYYYDVVVLGSTLFCNIEVS